MKLYFSIHEHLQLHIQHPPSIFLGSFTSDKCHQFSVYIKYLAAAVLYRSAASSPLINVIASCIYIVAILLYCTEYTYYCAVQTVSVVQSVLECVPSCLLDHHTGHTT